MPRSPARATQADAQRIRPSERLGMSRSEAAEYIGVSTTLFDAMVADGRMPAAKVIGKTLRWDRRLLDSRALHCGLDQPGFVYFVGFGPYVKIGYAKHVPGRVKELQTACPEKLEILHVEQASRRAERRYHEKFQAQRTTGEWFMLAGPIDLHIRLRAEKRHDYRGQ